MPLELPRGLTLYFARHGQTEANVEKRFSGNKDTPLTPGMNATVEIKTGQRRILEYILSPLQKATTEAIHER